MAAVELDRLLAVLAERDIPLVRDDVAWAFENTKTQDAAKQWVREYLSHSTLLTPDELDFYQQQGVPNLGALGFSGRSLSDAEVENAVTSIQRSTTDLEKQISILEKQKIVLRQLDPQSSRNEPAATARVVKPKTFAREKAELDVEMNELSQTLGISISSSAKQADAATATLPSQIERMLEKDDKVLAGLHKIMPKLADEPPQDGETVSADKLCTTLTLLSIEEIRSRLNSRFRSALLDCAQQTNGTAPPELNEQQLKQRDTLRSEVTELSSEIEGLVPIIVDHQYRKPIVQGLQSAKSDAQNQKAKWVEHINDTMLHLTARTQLFRRHAEQLHAHRSALRSLKTVFDETVATQAATNGPNMPSNADKAGAKGLKPLRLVQANFSEASDPALQTLKQLGIGIANPNDQIKLAASLESSLSERRQKAARLAAQTDSSITAAITQSLRDVDGDVQALLNAVYANSDFGSIKVIDGAVQSCFLDLEQNTQRIGEEMRDLDVDAIAKAVKLRQGK